MMDKKGELGQIDFICHEDHDTLKSLMVYDQSGREISREIAPSALYTQQSTNGPLPGLIKSFKIKANEQIVSTRVVYSASKICKLEIVVFNNTRPTGPDGEYAEIKREVQDTRPTLITKKALGMMKMGAEGFQ